MKIDFGFHDGISRIASRSHGRHTLIFHPPHQASIESHHARHDEFDNTRFRLDSIVQREFSPAPVGAKFELAPKVLRVSLENLVR